MTETKRRKVEIINGPGKWDFAVALMDQNPITVTLKDVNNSHPELVFHLVIIGLEHLGHYKKPLYRLTGKSGDYRLAWIDEISLRPQQFPPDQIHFSATYDPITRRGELEVTHLQKQR